MPVQPPTPPARRPFLMTLLAAGFAMCGLAGALRAYGAVQDWQLLLSLGIRPGPLYFLLGGIAWFLFGITACLGTLTGWYHADRLAALSAGVLAVSFWADRLLAARSGPQPSNTPFAALATLAGLLLTVLALRLPASRRFLNRRKNRG